MVGIDIDPNARTLYDDWQARRARLAGTAGEAADFHAVELRLLDYLLRRYQGSPEAARPARFPLATGVFVNHRAITVHHHLGHGLIPTITNAREAVAHVHSVVDRMQSPAAAPEAREPRRRPPLLQFRPRPIRRKPPARAVPASRRSASGRPWNWAESARWTTSASCPTCFPCPRRPTNIPASGRRSFTRCSSFRALPSSRSTLPWSRTRAEEADADGRMIWVIRWYRWMGVLGAVICPIVVLCFGPRWRRGPIRVAGVPGCRVLLHRLAGVFYASVRVADRLATDPEGVLPRARLVAAHPGDGVVSDLRLAGDFCLRSVTECFDVHCESFKRLRESRRPAGAGPPMSAQTEEQGGI